MKCTHLPLDGPTLALSYDELAVIALSGIAPLCIPRLLRQLAAQHHTHRLISEQSLRNSKQPAQIIYS